MKVKVDFSIFLADGSAFGYVDGELQLLTAPEIGDQVSFSFSSSGKAIPDGADLGGMLRVTGRIHSAAKASELTIMLEDMHVSDANAAVLIGAFLVDEFGVYLNAYG